MYDVLVAIPAYNSAHTINYVVRQAVRGLELYFHDAKSLVLVVDGGSTDGTPDVVRAYRIRAGNVDVRVEGYEGVRGKGSAIRHAFTRALEWGSSGLIMVDSDLRSIVPEWIKLLGSVVDGPYDLVTPLYLRHKYDATITNHLAYPLTRALYGVDMRQPIGGDFGLSRGLVEELARSDLWSCEDVLRFGIDIFITNSALAMGFRAAQAHLGTKIHEAKDPGKHLRGMMLQVAGSQFEVARRFRDVWWGISGVRGLPVLKAEIGAPGPPEVKVDVDNQLRVIENAIVRAPAIPGYDVRRVLLGSLESLRSGEPGLTHDTWAELVYAHLAAYMRGFRRNDVLESLYVCWLTRVLSFILETRDFGSQEAEHIILNQAKSFESKKEYLRSLL